MKAIIPWIATAALALSAPTDDFIARATETYGEQGTKAARFLVDNMPAADKETLTEEFLTENLSLAFTARETFPWAKDVPEEIFLNDVLPYAVFDEPRDPWRMDFFGKAAGLVKDAKTASEAAQILNRNFFKIINTHYHTGRKRTNQSPKESMEQGKATCTGLSIILVDACRAVGIPARAVGTPLWFDDSGNHTWVEIWDNGWHFTGADEYTEKGLNHGWFKENASKAIATDPLRSIYATSWKKDGSHFPMVWSPESKEVAGLNVTARYAVATVSVATTVGVRFFEGDKRIVMKGEIASEDGKVLGGFVTKAGTADLNDMPRLAVAPGQRYRLRFMIDGKTMETAPFAAADISNGAIDVRKSELRHETTD
jgi:Transglutaminase-like superfamily